MGKDSEGAQCWMKESSMCQIQSVSESRPNWVSLGLLQATYSARKQAKMGKYFHQKGNWFSFQKFSGFFPGPPVPDHTPFQPISRDIWISCIYFLRHLESQKYLRFKWRRTTEKLTGRLTKQWGVEVPANQALFPSFSPHNTLCETLKETEHSSCQVNSRSRSIGSEALPFGVF